MKYETIFTLGIVGVILYFIYKIISSPTTQAAITATGNALENASTGQLSQSQLDESAQQEAINIVHASGGTVSMQDALRQAQADQTLNQQSSHITYWDGVKAAFSDIF